MSVDYGAMYPDEEDIKLAFDRSYSIIQTELQNLKEILNRTIEGKTFVTADRCAEILHCNKNDIPSALPYYRASRVGSAGVLYKLSEIYNFIEERRIPKKEKEE